MDTEGLLRSLNAHDVEYVIIGATAFPVHGYARATLDVDVFIRPTTENARRVRLTRAPHPHEGGSGATQGPGRPARAPQAPEPRRVVISGHSSTHTTSTGPWRTRRSSPSSTRRPCASATPFTPDRLASKSTASGRRSSTPRTAR